MSSVSANHARKNNKVILLGDSGVGKTAIIERFTHNRFEAKQNATIGIDFVGKNVMVQGQTYRLQLWDTAGQERYRSLIPSYLKDASSAVFVYDITNQESVKNLQLWIELFKENKTEKSFLILCGNKLDLKEKENYDKAAVKNIAERYGMKSFVVSALSGEGVSEMFENIIELIHKNQQKKKKRFDQTTDVLPTSSQNLHAQQMISTRSQKSQRQQKRDQKVIKISSNETKMQKISSTEQERSQTGKVQGGNRCC